MNRIINPPDVAVALHYDGQAAPRVTASGRGPVAEQIMAVARQHDVPLHTDASLVEVLARVPLKTEIPRELYVAIAEVIAFAWYLGGKKPDDVSVGTPQAVGQGHQSSEPLNASVHHPGDVSTVPGNQGETVFGPGYPAIK